MPLRLRAETGAEALPPDRMPRYAPSWTAASRPSCASTRKVLETVKGMPPLSIDDKEKTNRGPGASMTGDDYVKNRVVDQIEYFTTRTAENLKAVDRYRRLGLIFGLAAMLLAVPAPAAASVLHGASWQAAANLTSSVASSVAAFLVANLAAG